MARLYRPTKEYLIKNPDFTISLIKIENDGRLWIKQNGKFHTDHLWSIPYLMESIDHRNFEEISDISEVFFDEV